MTTLVDWQVYAWMAGYGVYSARFASPSAEGTFRLADDQQHTINMSIYPSCVGAQAIQWPL